MSRNPLILLPPVVWYLGCSAIDGSILRHYAENLARLVREGDNRERRDLARHFVEKVTLEPETRTIDLHFRLPDNCAKHMEAASRLVALYSTLVVYRKRYACVPGNALRKQALKPLD